jgi:hypothetical protein
MPNSVYYPNTNTAMSTAMAHGISAGLDFGKLVNQRMSDQDQADHYSAMDAVARQRAEYESKKAEDEIRRNKVKDDMAAQMFKYKIDNYPKDHDTWQQSQEAMLAKTQEETKGLSFKNATAPIDRSSYYDFKGRADARDEEAANARAAEDYRSGISFRQQQQRRIDTDYQNSVDFASKQAQAGLNLNRGLQEYGQSDVRFGQMQDDRARALDARSHLPQDQRMYNDLGKLGSFNPDPHTSATKFANDPEIAPRIAEIKSIDDSTTDIDKFIAPHYAWQRNVMGAVEGRILDPKLDPQKAEEVKRLADRADQQRMLLIQKRQELQELIQKREQGIGPTTRPSGMGGQGNSPLSVDPATASRVMQALQGASAGAGAMGAQPGAMQQQPPQAMQQMAQPPVQPGKPPVQFQPQQASQQTTDSVQQATQNPQLRTQFLLWANTQPELMQLKQQMASFSTSEAQRAQANSRLKAAFEQWISAHMQGQ